MLHLYHTDVLGFGNFCRCCARSNRSGKHIKEILLVTNDEHQIFKHCKELAKASDQAHGPHVNSQQQSVEVHRDL